MQHLPFDHLDLISTTFSYFFLSVPIILPWPSRGSAESLLIEPCTIPNDILNIDDNVGYDAPGCAFDRLFFMGVLQSARRRIERCSVYFHDYSCSLEHWSCGRNDGGGDASVSAATAAIWSKKEHWFSLAGCNARSVKQKHNHRAKELSGREGSAQQQPQRVWFRAACCVRTRVTSDLEGQIPTVAHSGIQAFARSDATIPKSWADPLSPSRPT